MTIQTRAALLAVATLIRDATVEGENTALRVGGYCYDLLDSTLLQSELRQPSAKCVATSNVTPLSGLTTSADGITASADGVDVILLTGQSTASQNGPWVVAAGSWSRPAWFPVGGNAGGFMITVQQGTNHAESLWQCTTNDPNAVIGTDDLSWIRQGAGSYAASKTLTIGGNSYCANQEFRIATGGDFGWFINNDERMNLSNSNELNLIRGGTSGATYSQWKENATGCTHNTVVSSGTTHPYLTATATGVLLGDATVTTSAAVTVSAGGTVYVDVGANHACEVTASGHVWRAGSNQIASATALLCNWGDTSNVTTADISASTTLHGYIGPNAAWTATVSGHTWKAGANQVAGANATTCTWGHATNVTTSDISATTTIHGFIGTQAVLTATATGLGVAVSGAALPSTGTLKISQEGSIWSRTSAPGDAHMMSIFGQDLYLGSDTAVQNVVAFASVGHVQEIGTAWATSTDASGFSVYYQSDITDYLVIASNGTTSTFTRKTTSLTANAFLAATATTVSLGDATNTQTIDFQAAASAATFEFKKGAALQAEIDDGGLTVFDVGTASQFVTISSAAITGSKDLTSGLTITVAEATGANDGKDLILQTAGAPAGRTPGNLVINLNDDDGTTKFGSLIVQTVGGAYQLLEIQHDGTPKIGVFNATPVAKPTVSGARNNPEAALANVLAALDSLGWIANSTTAS